MLFTLSVITAKDVTSDPVPEVVGIATILACLPNLGNLYILFLISINLSLKSSKSASLFS